MQGFVAAPSRGARSPSDSFPGHLRKIRSSTGDGVGERRERLARYRAGRRAGGRRILGRSG